MRWQPIGVGALLVAAACGGESAEDEAIRPLGDPSATTTGALPSATTTPPTTEPDPWAVPETPDAAYFERVLNELMVLDGELLLAIRDAGEFTDEHLRRLQAFSTGINLEYEEPALRALGEQWDERIVVVRPAANAGTEVLELVGGCAVVETLRSFDGVHNPERAPTRLAIRLQRSSASTDNPTGWKVSESWSTDRDVDVTCA